MTENPKCSGCGEMLYQGHRCAPPRETPAPQHDGDCMHWDDQSAGICDCWMSPDFEGKAGDMGDFDEAVAPPSAPMIVAGENPTITDMAWIDAENGFHAPPETTAPTARGWKDDPDSYYTVASSATPSGTLTQEFDAPTAPDSSLRMEREYFATVDRWHATMGSSDVQAHDSTVQAVNAAAERLRSLSGLGAATPEDTNAAK